MKFGKRVSRVLVFLAMLALAPLVALLTLCSDDGDLLFVCKDWVKRLFERDCGIFLAITV
jgi:hypothetical protein